MELVFFLTSKSSSHFPTTVHLSFPTPALFAFILDLTRQLQFFAVHRTAREPSTKPTCFVAVLLTLPSQLQSISTRKEKEKEKERDARELDTTTFQAIAKLQNLHACRCAHPL